MLLQLKQLATKGYTLLRCWRPFAFWNRFQRLVKVPPGVRRAADNMFVSQPTFSYQIRLLEEEIGFAVFERSGKGAALTPAGEQFVSFLTGMREDLKRAIE